MELHELHVAHHGPGPIGHGVSVAGGHQRVGGTRVDLSGPAAREHHRPGQTHRQLSLFAQGRGTHTAASIHQQVDDELVLVQLDPAPRGDDVGQGACHHAAGRVPSGVDHTGPRVGPLFPQDQLPVALVEPSAELFQLPYARRALLYQNAHCLLIAEAYARFQCVLEVQFGRVVRAHGRGDAALGKERGGLVEGALGDEAHVPTVRGPQRSREPGDPTADHQDVVARVAEVGSSARYEGRDGDGGRTGGTRWTVGEILGSLHAADPFMRRPRSSASRHAAPSPGSRARRSPPDLRYAARSVPCPGW